MNDHTLTHLLCVPCRFLVHHQVRRLLLSSSSSYHHDTIFSSILVGFCSSLSSSSSYRSFSTWVSFLLVCRRHHYGFRVRIICSYSSSSYHKTYFLSVISHSASSSTSESYHFLSPLTALLFFLVACYCCAPTAAIWCRWQLNFKLKMMTRMRAHRVQFISATGTCIMYIRTR